MEVREEDRVWVSQAEAARVTGIPARTIREWVSNRSIAIGEKSMVDLIELFWRERERKQKKIQRLKNGTSNEPKVRLALAQCRKIEADAALREYELKDLRERFISLKEAIADLDIARELAQERFSKIPDMVAETIAQLEDPRSIEKVLEDAVYQALADLQNDFIRAGEGSPLP
jgi:hypothetical protein